MKRLFAMLMLATIGCEREPDLDDGNAAKVAAEVLPPQGPVSKPPAVVPLPKDQAEIDRMILAGYTPHADHLHAPGVNSCPLTKGNEAVM